MSVAIYNGIEVIVKWGEVDLMVSRNKEEFVSIETLGEDPIQTESDLDGNVIVWGTKEKRHTIVVTLSQSSPANDMLSAIINSAQYGDLRLGFRPLTIKDPNGTSSYFDANCILVKRPSVKYGEKPTTRQWTFIATDLDRYDGSSGPLV